jgi:hypothetical protein
VLKRVEDEGVRGDFRPSRSWEDNGDGGTWLWWTRLVKSLLPPRGLNRWYRDVDGFWKSRLEGRMVCERAERSADYRSVDAAHKKMQQYIAHASFKNYMYALVSAPAGETFLRQRSDLAENGNPFGALGGVPTAQLRFLLSSDSVHCIGPSSSVTISTLNSWTPPPKPLVDSTGVDCSRSPENSPSFHLHLPFK